MNPLANMSAIFKREAQVFLLNFIEIFFLI